MLQARVHKAGLSPPGALCAVGLGPQFGGRGSSCWRLRASRSGACPQLCPLRPALAGPTAVRQEAAGTRVAVCGLEIIWRVSSGHRRPLSPTVGEHTLCVVSSLRVNPRRGAPHRCPFVTDKEMEARGGRGACPG